MRGQYIQLRGAFRYPSRGEMERALERARALIDDHEPDWVRMVVRQGATLQVDTIVPRASDRYVTAAVLEALASAAIGGVVEARCEGRCIDWFPSRNQPS